MDLQTLRDQIRDLLSEDSTNLPDATLNDLIERCTQRIEADLCDDYGTTPRQMIGSSTGEIGESGYRLPGDLSRIKTVSVGDNVMRYIPIESLPGGTSGEGSTLTVTYYKRLDKLVEDTDTNWLLDVGSRVYVFGTAIEYTLWNRESEGDRARYADEYTNALERTARSNSPRPSGGFGRSRGAQYGFYSVSGDFIIFGKGQACTGCIETEAQDCILVE